MKLTPLDIRSKQFKRTMRGYIGADVDDFLEQLAEEFERLFAENIALDERCEAMAEQLERYGQLEQTLQNTLVVAKHSAEELTDTAQKEAELVRSEATLTARRAIADAYPAQQALTKEIAVLRGVEEDLRFRFRSLLERYARQLDEAETRTTGGGGVAAASDTSEEARASQDTSRPSMP